MPLGQQRIESNEKIEIDRAQVHETAIQSMNIDSTKFDWINGPQCDLLCLSRNRAGSYDDEYSGGSD